MAFAHLNDHLVLRGGAQLNGKVAEMIQPVRVAQGYDAAFSRGYTVVVGVVNKRCMEAKPLPEGRMPKC